MFNRSKKWLITSSVATALLVNSTCYAADGERPATPIKVDVVTLIKLTATTKLMGTVHSQSHIAITSGVSANLNSLVEPGSQVKKGDILVTSDLRPLQLRQMEQQAQIRRQKIHVKYLANELQRLVTLIKTNTTSQFQVDQAKSQHEIALADVEISQFKLAIIEDQLKRATLRAPFDGTVTQRLARAGTDVNRGDILLKLLDTQHLEVHVFIPVKYLKYVRNIKTLELGLEQQQVTAMIGAVIPNVDPLSQTFEVRIKIPNHFSQTVASGQLIQVTVPTQDNRAKLTIARDALILRKDGSYVVKIDGENKAHRIKVEVGGGNNTRISVSGELVKGDRVATRGAERLKDGQSVSVN